MTPHDLVMSAASTSASGAGGSSPTLYVDDVFSTYLYTGDGSTQTINNGINLTGSGGMVWIKSRSTAGVNPTTSSIGINNHYIFDTVRTNQNVLCSSSAVAQDTSWGGNYFNFLNTGFNCGVSTNTYTNNISEKYTSWTFRKSSKFFDIVTWTGTGNTQTISHNLGVKPGMIIVKNISAGYNWYVWHNGLSSLNHLYFDGSSAQVNGGGNPWIAEPTETSFQAGGYSAVQFSGHTMVAYLFAHDTSANGIIKCGSFTADGSNYATVDLGWEPQYLMYKRIDSVGDWNIVDNMRGMSNSPPGYLRPNTSEAEVFSGTSYIAPLATGFHWHGVGAGTYIYMAIRRTNKPPTSGSQVFKSVLRTGTGSNLWVASGAGFPPDMTIMGDRSGLLGTNYAHSVIDRLRRAAEHIQLTNTNGEGGGWGAGHIHNMDGYDGLYTSDSSYYNALAKPYVDYHFKRAPGFFDIICWTGDGTSSKTLNHSLGVVPELVIEKNRVTAGYDWLVTHKDVTTINGQYLWMNSSAAVVTGAVNNYLWPQGYTNTVITVGGGSYVNATGSTYVAYLFASRAGISKVGSYTGNGSSQTINCGFAAGARFILIKRTDAVGDWYVWDSARGIAAANDPHLSLNSESAEVTTDDSIDTDNTGFIVNQVAATNINVTSATYIFLAIA